MEVAETKVQLPAGLEPPFEVYVNGVRQLEGSDFGLLGFCRWTSLVLGVACTNRKHDSVDVVYEVDGRRIVRTGLPYAPYEPIETGER